MNNYFYANEADLFTFYRIPKELIKSEKYNKMNLASKILYGLLLDRNSLSIKNNWVDKQGRIFIIYTRKETQNDLNTGTQKVCKLYDELKQYGLIEEVRQGINKPNLIYVKKFYNTYQERTFENQNSGVLKIKSQDFRKSKCNNTDTSNTDLNNTTTNKKIVVDDNYLNNFIVRFKEKYDADFNKSRLIELYFNSGKEIIEKYFDNYNKFLMAGNINDIAGYFYKAVKDNYSIPVSSKINKKPSQCINYSQREYSDEYFNSLYENI